MPTLFPGMDPYLEQRWNAVHKRLIVAIADALAPQLRPRYRVDIELRTYIALFSSESPAGIPDVRVMRSPTAPTTQSPVATPMAVAPELVEIPMPEEVRERYLTVRDVATEEVVTVIEVLSLANKLTNEGRTEYLSKRQIVLASQTNLVEIDLLRAGEPLPPFQAGDSHYRILVSPAQDRPLSRVFRFGVRQPIPDFTIPVRPGETEPLLPLNQLLHELYDRGGYDLAIDYSRPPSPPLSNEEMAWVQSLRVN